MRACRIVTTALVIAVAVGVAAAGFRLEHRLPHSASFTARSVVNVKTVRARSARSAPISVDVSGSGAASSKDFRGLVAGRDLYTIRLVPDGTDADPSQCIVASVDACSLLMSGFSDVLVFQSTSSGSIFHVKYSTPVQAPLNGTCPAPPSSVKFKTSTYVGTPKEGPVPLNLESVYKEPEAVPEQQSFFRKYWYVIVPLVIGVLVSSLGSSE
ncbi:Uncharacterized protein PBTT_07878 [Plasmodiophora brassicae]